MLAIFAGGLNVSLTITITGRMPSTPKHRTAVRDLETYCQNILDQGGLDELEEVNGRLWDVVLDLRARNSLCRAVEQQPA